MAFNKAISALQEPHYQLVGPKLCISEPRSYASGAETDLVAVPVLIIDAVTTDVL